MLRYIILTVNMTDDDKVVAAVTLAALGAGPVLVPDVRAEAHGSPPDAQAVLLGGAPLGHVVLLEGSLGPVRSAAPSDLAHARVLSVLARLQRLLTFAAVLLLVRAHVTLQTHRTC